MDSRAPNLPRPVTLTLAAVVVALQGVGIAIYGVLEVVHTSAANLGMAVTTALFFIAIGAGLLAAGHALAGVRSWARSPVVAVELIEVLTAYSFLGGDTTLVAVVLAVVAVVVLGCLLHPASTRALAADQT